MEWHCGRRELIEPSREWAHYFFMESIQIPGFPAFVLTHLAWVRARSKSTKLPKKEMSMPWFRVSSHHDRVDIIKLKNIE